MNALFFSMIAVMVCGQASGALCHMLWQAMRSKDYAGVGVIGCMWIISTVVLARVCYVIAG